MMRKLKCLEENRGEHLQCQDLKKDYLNKMQKSTNNKEKHIFVYIKIKNTCVSKYITKVLVERS